MFDIPRWAENTSHTMWLCGQSKIHTLWHEAGCIATRYMPLQWLTMRSCEQKCNKIVGWANVTTAVIVWTSATCQDTTPHLVYSGSTPQGGAGQSCNSSLATAISIPQQSFSIHHSWAIAKCAIKTCSLTKQFTRGQLGAQKLNANADVCIG